MFFRIDLVEHLSHLGILRDGLHMEEGLQIIAVGLILHSPLELEKRGVLEEHHRKCAHADVVHRMVRLRLLAAVREWTETAPRAFLSSRKVLDVSSYETRRNHIIRGEKSLVILRITHFFS